MIKLLITALAVVFIGGCVITPPGSLQAERERHAKEMESLRASMHQVERQLSKARAELGTCRTDLEAERALRNDHQRAVAYVQWCNKFGLAIGMCNDALYFEGIAASRAGERASGKWQIVYFGTTAIILMFACGLMYRSWQLTQFISRFLGGVKSIKKLMGAEENLRTLKADYSRTSKKLSQAESRLSAISAATAKAEKELQQRKSELESVRKDLEDADQVGEMLDVQDANKKTSCPRDRHIANPKVVPKPSMSPKKKSDQGRKKGRSRRRR